jgi:hypothetical protein
MSIEKADSAPGYMAGASSADEYGLRWSERQAAADAAATGYFLWACEKRDANAPAFWAPKVGDYSTPWREGVPQPQRIPALHEVLTDSLDYTTGPQMSEVMQILLNVAHGDAGKAPEQARVLLDRMASTWARYNAPEVE